MYNERINIEREAVIEELRAGKGDAKMPQTEREAQARLLEGYGLGRPRRAIAICVHQNCLRIMPKTTDVCSNKSHEGCTKSYFVQSLDGDVIAEGGLVGSLAFRMD